jgi:ligand-binding SRPBCC domain-containing protein
MVTLTEITLIHAPIERCFDLSRSIDLHKASTAETNEQAVAGVTSGLIGMGEEVTWRARHFGVWQQMTSCITVFDRPQHFQDTMVRGAFHFFQHDHYFRQQSDGAVEMKDILRFSAPLGLLGRVAELPLKPYLRRFLQQRNAAHRQIAESGQWRSFLNSKL